jgi:hypothetical protein
MSLPIEKKVMAICQKMIDFSKLDTTKEEQDDFFDSCYKEVSDYFHSEKDFFMYVLVFFKENKNELLKSES